MKQEQLDSVVSYGGGTGIIAYSHLSEVATIAQQLGMIAGFILICVKLAYDIRKFWRERNKK